MASSSAALAAALQLQRLSKMQMHWQGVMVFQRAESQMSRERKKTASYSSAPKRKKKIEVHSSSSLDYITRWGADLQNLEGMFAQESNSSGLCSSYTLLRAVNFSS